MPHHSSLDLTSFPSSLLFTRLHTKKEEKRLFFLRIGISAKYFSLHLTHEYFFLRFPFLLSKILFELSLRGDIALGLASYQRVTGFQARELDKFFYLF